MPLHQNAAQPSPHHLIEFAQHVGQAAPKVSVPAPYTAAHSLDEDGQALPACAGCLLPYRLFELFLALGPRPLIASFVVVAQKVESATLRGVHDTGLGWVQLQSGGF